MEDTTTKSGSYISGGGGSSKRDDLSSGGGRGGWALGMENPFSFKVAQVFTGVGVGCGIGIGIGRPIYLGAIPALQQVLFATRGATDVFSGAGRHVNSTFRKFGVKTIEAGIGCGVGVGHGFGVGLALKPGIIQRIQSCLGQAMAKILMNTGKVPGLSAVQGAIPSSVQNSIPALSGIFDKMQTPAVDVLQLASETTESTSPTPRSDKNSHSESTHEFLASKATPSETSTASRTENVIRSFLQNPLLQNEEEPDVNELVGKLRSENNVLQVLLKHQQVIEELIEENEKLRQVLVDDLKVPPSKFETNGKSWIASNSPCSDCLECRRKRRYNR